MAGGGVGEAMLIGAAVGAGTGAVSSAVQKKDVLQGALLGGAMGAAGGGLGSGAGSLLGEQLAEQGGEQLVEQGVEQGAQQAVQQTASNAPAFGSSQGLGYTGQFGGGSSFGGTGGATVGPNTFAGSVMDSGSAAPGVGSGMFPGMSNAQAYGAGIGGGIMGLVGQQSQNVNNFAPAPSPYTGPLSKFNYDPNKFRPSVAPGFAEGGITSLATGGVQQTDMFPQSQMDRTQFATPSQMPISKEIIASDYDTTIDPYTGDLPRFANGGISNLGGYSDGGRLLRGPGDGMSDNIPASIAGKQPARLADGEFVVPADVVSGLGNGSTDAGAKTLYSMMDKVRQARTGTKKQGRQIKADKFMPKMASGGRVDDYGVSRFDTGGVSSSFQASGFDPNYYNPQYYQSQLDAANKKLAAAKSTPGFDAAYYLKQNPDVARNDVYGSNPYQHYLDYGIKEGRSPFEGGTAGQALGDSSAVSSAQSQVNAMQQNLNRLAGTTTKYDPYTMANRPSGNQPQFYGNIYKGAGAPDFSTPGYTLTGGNLGQWSNVAGEAQRAAQPASMNQQITQSYLRDLGRAPDQAGFDYWSSSGLTGPQIQSAISGSKESVNVNPYNARNASLAVGDLYQQLLGRQPDQPGLDYWSQQISSGKQSPDQVAANMKYSPEYMVRQAYQSSLGRNPDAEGLQYWQSQMGGGMTADQMRAAIGSSAEGKAYAAAQQAAQQAVQQTAQQPQAAEQVTQSANDEPSPGAMNSRKGGIIKKKRNGGIAALTRR